MRPDVIYDPGLKELLQRAALAYRARDDAAFRALLEEAVRRAPQRVDVRLGLANHLVQTGAAEAAAGVLRETSRAVARDVDVLTCLAHWERYLGNAPAAAEAWERLAAARRGRAEDVERIWREIDAWLAKPVVDTLPEMRSERLAVVLLGYVLHDDGGMDGILVERLEKTLAAAERYPAAVVVATGGVPRGGRVEATAMREWLTARGVADERIFEEGYARDVVENLLYSRQILDILGVDGVLCVTSAVDVRRTGAGLGILSWAGGSGWSEIAVAASSGASFAAWNDDGGDRLKIYRDALRAYGLPMMRSYPELVEL